VKYLSHSRRLKIYDPMACASAIEDILKIFRDLLRDCESKDPEVQRLLDKIEDLLTMGGFVKAFCRIFTNPFKFAKLIRSIINLFDHEEWYKAGYDVGYMAGLAMGTRLETVKDYFLLNIFYSLI
jgi:hypothetical protein